MYLTFLQLLIQAEEIELLKQKIIALETEKLNFQKLYDAAIVSLNSFTSPTSENRCLELQIPEKQSPTQDQILMDQCLVNQTNVNKVDQSEGTLITSTAAENHYGSGNSIHSVTPEQFEMIDNEKNSGM